MTVNLTEPRRQWLSELYVANSAAVFNQCRRLLKSPEDAADATQEIFIRAAASLSEETSSSQARAWLNTVARNYCIDLLRRRERLGSAMTTLATTADRPSEPVESVEDRELLLAVLPQLSLRERQALWQSAVEDLPLREIARSLGVSYLAAAQLLHRARRRALALATRLAIILGLAQVGRAARRANAVQRLQLLAAVVAMPAAFTLVIASSAGQQPVLGARAQPAQRGVAVRSSPPVQKPVTPVTGALPVTGASSVAAVVAAPAAAATRLIAPAAPVAAPTAKPTPPPIDRDRDHGKGRDRDDAVHKHPWL